MSFEAYKIAVSIKLVEHVSAGLASLSTHFKRTDMDAAALQKRLDSIGKMTLAGGLLAGAGILGLKALHGTIEEAKKLAQARADFETMNLGKGANAEAFAKAASNAHKVLGTTITENVKQIHDLHTAFGDLHHALSTSEDFAKLSVVAGVASHGKTPEGLVNAAAKALEHRGGKVINDEQAFKAELAMMSQVMLGSKMRVSPADYLAASKTGKMAYQMYDKEYLYGNFAGLMQINGGDRQGTQGMTAFSSLIGGHMDAKAKGFLSDIGLYQEGFSKARLKQVNASMSGMSPEEKKIAIASMGGQAMIAGGLKDELIDKFTHRPDLFIKENLAPAIRSRFGLDLSNEKVAAMIAAKFNRNTGDFLGTQITMASKLEKDSAIFGKSMDFRSGYAHYLKSPAGAEKAAEDAMVNFKAIFGSVFLPSFTAGMLKLAKFLDGIGQMMERHPIRTEWIGNALALASGLAVLGGGLLLTKAALSGLNLVVGPLTRALIGSTGLIGAAGKSGVAIGVLAAAIGGYAVGSFISSCIEGTKAADKIGSAIAHIFAFFGSKDAQAAINAIEGTAKGGDTKSAGFGENGGGAAFGNPNIRHRAGGDVHVTVTNNVNERGITSMVTRNQSKELSRPLTGPRTFDGSMSPQGTW